jgi:hypothetical protein
MFPAVTKENRKIVEHNSRSVTTDHCANMQMGTSSGYKWDHPSNVIDQKSIKLNFKGLMNFKAMF